MSPEISRAGFLSYKDLDVWKQARELTIEVYRLTDKEPIRHSRALCDQMQRAAVSIPSNIAEGDERGTNKEALRFLYISKGSLAELRTQLDIAQAVGRLSGDDHKAVEVLAERVARLLSGTIKMRLERERAASGVTRAPR